MNKVYAHRGMSGQVIENTSFAIQLCVDHNISLIEVDIQLLGDMTPVLFHDCDLNRLGNDSKKMSELNRESFAKTLLKMPDKKDQFPLFMDEFIKLIIKNNLKVNIELKRFEQSIESYIQYIINPFLKIVPLNQVLVSSFDMELLKAVREYSSTVDIAVLSRKLDDSVIKSIQSLNAKACHLQDCFLKLNQIGIVKKHAEHLGVFTVNDNQRYNELINSGVDYVFSDYPDTLK